jgi:hypothetical protein
MSSASGTARGTKIFGIRLGVDPKIVGGGLAALTIFFLWFNLHGNDDDEHTVNGGTAAAVKSQPLTPANRPAAGRRFNPAARDRAVLSMKPVDPTRGDIDPTLRLGLLERLKNLQFHGGGRNLFDGGTEISGLPAVPKGPKLLPKPIAAAVVPIQNSTPVALPVNIPFKYYGFVKPAGHGDSNRGFFMSGDNVLVGIEGDVLLSRYLIVSLTPNSARIEDMQMKQGQDLIVAPEAISR